MAERARVRLDQRTQDLVLVGATTAVLLVLTQFVFPGSQGDGTPFAILFRGLIFGLLNALVAVGIVLIHRSHRFINFAQASFGIGGGVFTANLMSLNGWPYFVAFVAGVVVSAGLGLIFQLGFVMRFFNAPRLVLTVLSIAIIPGIGAATGFVTSLPIFPPVEERSLDQLTGQIVLPFDGFTFTIGGLGLRFGFAHVFALGVSVVVLLALAAFFRFSRVGVAVRAAAENNERARLLGISTGVLSIIVWTIAGGLSGFGVVLAGGIQGRIAPGFPPPELLIIPLAAAVLGRFASFPLTVFAAVLLSVARDAFGFSYQGQLGLFDVVLLVVLLGGLLLNRQRQGRAEEHEATAWESVQEQRPIPTEMLAIPSVVVARRALFVIAALALIIFPLAATPGATNLAGFLILVAIAILSLVVLTGWAGQVSLGQFGFVAIGAVLGGAMTARWGISFWFAIFLVPIATSLITLVLGLPALRIRGFFLGVVTFAFAIAVQSVLFEERYFSWLLPGAVNRPALFFLDFEDNRSMYYLNLVALGLAVGLVGSLRRSRPGRLLIAMRDNESNLRSFGVNPMRMRLVAFAISGFLCGLSGVLIAHHQRAVTAADFPAQTSVEVFLFSVVGGVGSITGALLGALYYALLRLISNPAWLLFAGPVGLLVVLYVSPSGLAGLFTGLRDGILRIIAQRRQMIVPALYADMDPAALERRLIPLAEPIPSSGLGALPYDQRYTTESSLYGRRGQIVVAGEERKDEAVALGAAAEHFGEDEPVLGRTEG